MGSMRRRVTQRSNTPMLFALLVVLALVGVACSSTADADADSPPGIPGIGDSGSDSASAPPTTTFDIDAAYDLGDPIEFHQAQMGECLNEYDWVQDRQPRNLLIALDCSLPHDKEVYLIDVFDAGPDVPYPGEELMKDIATRKCYNQFANFVGQTYEDSQFDIDLTFPPRENYLVGNYRDIICMVTSSEQTVGSAKGSGL